MKELVGFERISPFVLKENVFDMLQDEWMLITAGNQDKFNTMTAAWGGFGILWRKPIAIIFVRPQRFTYQFTEQYQNFTLSFFGHGNYREALSFCGSKSGRNFDKPRETGLTAVNTDNGNIAFQEARLIFDCRKLYTDSIKPEMFNDFGISESIYPTKDFHRFYIGEITGCYRKL